jgi:hypothetical protein
VWLTELSGPATIGGSAANPGRAGIDSGDIEDGDFALGTARGNVIGVTGAADGVCPRPAHAGRRRACRVALPGRDFRY